jgi:asparaginyl-tRNA synthetase
LFRVSTLDLANLPRTQEGEVDFAQDFFRREAFLTVSGQLNVEAYCLALTKVDTFGPTFRRELEHQPPPRRVLDDRAGDRLRRPLGQCGIARSIAQIHLRGVTEQRAKDLAFFDQRIEKGLVAKLEGIVGSQFVHMDYSEAIQVLEQANEKFEFPVNWGVDLQSEHERYLTEKYPKKPVIVMNYPKPSRPSTCGSTMGTRAQADR